MAEPLFPSTSILADLRILYPICLLVGNTLSSVWLTLWPTVTGNEECPRPTYVKILRVTVPMVVCLTYLVEAVLALQYSPDWRQDSYPSFLPLQHTRLAHHSPGCGSLQHFQKCFRRCRLGSGPPARNSPPHRWFSGSADSKWYPSSTHSRDLQNICPHTTSNICVDFAFSQGLYVAR